MDCSVAAKVAVRELSAIRVVVQGAVPVQRPLHPLKAYVFPAAAVRVTWVPEAKLALHVWGQLMPGGMLVTTPEPAPAGVTVSCTCCCGGWTDANAAVTEVLALTVVTQVGVLPAQFPPQAEKSKPVAGIALRVTCVPEAKFAAQVWGQLMPTGELITVPVPVSFTVNWICCG